MRLVKVCLIALSLTGLASCANNKAPAPDGSSSTSAQNTGIIANAVYFSINSALVAESYTKILTINAGYLISHNDATVQIQGNSSEVGTSQHNQELGMQRAQNVKQALIKMGVPSQQISVVSFGNRKPLFASGANGQQPKNQRADIIYNGAVAPYQYTVTKLPMINLNTMY